MGILSAPLKLGIDVFHSQLGMMYMEGLWG